MRLKVIIIGIFISTLSSISAASLIAPFPSIGVSEIDVELRYYLIQKSRIELYCNTGINLDWSIIPLIAAPGLALNVGINGSFFFKDNFNGFNLRLATGIAYYLNPFFYKDKYYEMDQLLVSSTDLTLNYRVDLNNKCFLEPYLGGRLSFFDSFSSYSGIKSFVSILGGVSFSINWGNVLSK